MLYAKTFDGTTIKATRELKGQKIKVFCPFCDPLNERPLIIKLGEEKRPHFAHPKGAECDSWSSGKETDWHIGWKELVDKKYCEVTIEKNGERHRADIKNKNNLVIELQHSNIDKSNRMDRELFYGDMVWLFDATYLYKNFCLGLACKLKSDVVFYEYTWKWARKWILNTEKPLFLDMGDDLIFYIPNNSFKEGYGCAISKYVFINKVLKGKGLKKLPRTLYGFTLWIEQIICDIKEEQRSIRKIIDCTLYENESFQKDIDEQIFFNAIQDEIQFCNDSYEAQICTDEQILYDALQEEIKLSNETCKSIIAEEEQLKIEKDKLRFTDQNKKEISNSQRPSHLLKFYCDNFSYDPVIVHLAMFMICLFLATNSVKETRESSVCHKIKFAVDDTRISNNLKLKVFNHLKEEGIITYSKEHGYWILSNSNFLKKITGTDYHKSLKKDHLIGTY